MRAVKLKHGLISALIIACTLSALAIYTWQTWGVWCFEEAAVEEALEFLRKSPTYRFDGIPESVRVEGVERLGPASWRIKIAFVCRHSGYGDRTGEVILQVLTPHRILIKLERGIVVEAVIDDVWNELIQEPIKR